MIQFCIVWYKHFMIECMFYHRMPSIRNGNAAFLLREDLRSYITVLQSCPCKACYAVNTRQSRSCSLHVRNFRAYFRFDHLVDLKFELFGLFLGGERFSLEFLQLGVIYLSALTSVCFLT